MGRLVELAERAERATGPDRELDAVIFHALGMPLPDKFAHHSIALEYDEIERSFIAPLGDMRVRYEHPAYTASIDAAMQLVPEGWDLELRAYAIGRFYAELKRTVEATTPGGLVYDLPVVGRALTEGETPALAICASSLRARDGGEVAP